MDLPAQPVEQVTEAAISTHDQRSHLREDGTLVINILVDPPCGEANADEIVVCAAAQDVPRYEAPDARQREEPKAEVQISENAKVGAHAEPGRYGAVEALVTLTVEF